MRTIIELLHDLGILERESEDFKSDVLAYLDEHTRSSEATLKLAPPEIKILTSRFIDSDKGTVYFTRWGSNNEWRHGKSREDVMAALPDITKRWLKNKKDTIQKREAARLARDTKSTSASRSVLPDKDTSKPIGRSPHLGTKQVIALAPFNATSPANDFYEDDDEDALPDIPYDGQTDASSLPDVAELLHEPRQYVDPGKGRTTRTSGHANGNPISTARSETDAGSIYADDSQYTSVLSNDSGLLSPPQTSLKRKHHDSEEQHDRERSPLPREGGMRKKTREHSGTQPQSPVITTPSKVLATSATFEHNVPVMSSVVVDLPSVASGVHTGLTSLDNPAQSSVLLSTALSNKSMSSQRLDFSQVALLELPAVVLDYVRQCEKSSLSKANRQSISVEDRRRHQERSKIFRDLHADLESRIVSLAHSAAKTEADIGPETREERTSSQPEISSYALWD